MPETAFPSRHRGPDESPGFLLWTVSNAWQRRVRAALEPLGLTHVQFVLLASLAWLARDGAVVTQVELARHAATDVMMTSQVLRALESRGLLERHPHPADARARALAACAIPAVEAADAAFFGDHAGAIVPLLRSLAET